MPSSVNIVLLVKFPAIFTRGLNQWLLIQLLDARWRYLTVSKLRPCLVELTLTVELFTILKSSRFIFMKNKGKKTFKGCSVIVKN